MGKSLHLAIASFQKETLLVKAVFFCLILALVLQFVALCSPYFWNDDSIIFYQDVDYSAVEFSGNAGLWKWCLRYRDDTSLQEIEVCGSYKRADYRTAPPLSGTTVPPTPKLTDAPWYDYPYPPWYEDDYAKPPLPLVSGACFRGNEFPCDSDFGIKVCIGTNDICDGDVDCPGFSDEVGCGTIEAGQAFHTLAIIVALLALIMIIFFLFVSRTMGSLIVLKLTMIMCFAAAGCLFLGDVISGVVMDMSYGWSGYFSIIALILISIAGTFLSVEVCRRTCHCAQVTAS